jgi:ribonuclease D
VSPVWLAVNYRRKKRSQEHAAADRHNSGGSGRAPLDHPLVRPGKAEVVETPAALDALIADVRTHAVIAYDTEFIGEESFYPKLCLVQVATPTSIALVDPVPLAAAGRDLSELFRAIAEPGRTILVHSGETDIDILRRGAGAEPSVVFDTQVAAALAWMPWPSSLGTVLETLTGYRLGKAHTFTNWDARPLTPAQLGYAADDVRYMHLIWSELSARLSSLGRADWAMSESREQLRSGAFDPDGQLRRLHRSEPLRPGQMLVARELVMLRYELAKSHDLPARVVLPDAAVIELCKRKPTDRGAIAAVAGIPRRISAAHADDISAAITRAKGAAPESEPANPLADDMRVRAEGDQLWSALQARCAATGLAANLVATRSVFSRWFLASVEARRAGRFLGCTEGENAMFQSEDWRHAAVGRWIDGFLRGEERLELEWSPSGMVAPGFVRPGAVASGG